MDVKGRMILTVVLAALLGVLGGPASWNHHAARGSRPEASGTAGTRSSQVQKASQPAPRRPLLQVAALEEFAEFEPEETDKDPGSGLITSFGHLLLHDVGPDPVRGSRRFSSRPESRPPTRLFLICRRLVC